MERGSVFSTAIIAQVGEKNAQQGCLTQSHVYLITDPFALARCPILLPKRLIRAGHSVHATKACGMFLRCGLCWRNARRIRHANPAVRPMVVSRETVRSRLNPGWKVRGANGPALLAGSPRCWRMLSFLSERGKSPRLRCSTRPGTVQKPNSRGVSAQFRAGRQL